MERIKIAQVITRLDWGGPPDIVRMLCSNLDPHLYELKIICGSTQHVSAATEEFLKHFKDALVNIPSLQRDIHCVRDFAAFVRLYVLFRKERFDIVHTHTAKAGALGRMAAFLAGCPVIIHTPHGHNFYGYFGKIISAIIVFLEKFLTLLTTKIIVVTELEKKDMVRFKVADPEKICIIRHGMELERYSALTGIDKACMRETLQVQPDEEVVGMIGRLEPVKGPHYFVDAAALVAKNISGIKFILVGEGSLRSSLEKKVQDLQLKERFIFTGWRNDIPELLSIFNVLVLPSLNEAAGMVLIEAQAAGVPIVATNVGGIPEMVQEGQTALLVAPKDSTRLAEAISYLLKDKEKRLQMSAFAREWVKDKFEAKVMVHKTTALYQELINNFR